MERIASIELALKNEDREQEFYNQQAQRSKNPVVIRLMKTLAKEEEDHKKWIELIHERLSENGTWPLEVKTEESELPKELGALDHENENIKKHEDEDIIALKKAVAFEKDAADFYMRIVKNSSDEKEKSFFSFLAQIEHQHMLSISDSIEYLQSDSSWFNVSEHRGMDGA